MHKVYAAGAPDRTSGAIVSASDALRDSLATGVAEGADAVAHTGDLVNFPSPAAVANAQRILEETGAARAMQRARTRRKYAAAAESAQWP